MRYSAFERQLLHLAFTSDLPLTPQTVAFALGLSIEETELLLNEMVAHDALEVEHDDQGHARYHLHDRAEVRRSAWSLVPRRPSFLVMPHTPVRRNLAIIGLILNLLLLPGVGSLVAGRYSSGLAQLTLALIALPLCFVVIGIPLLAAAWLWGLATSIRSLSEPDRAVSF